VTVLLLRPMSDFQGRRYAGTLLSKAQTALPSLTPHHFRQLSAYLEELKRLTSDGVLLGFSLVYVSRWKYHLWFHCGSIKTFGPHEIIQSTTVESLFRTFPFITFLTWDFQPVLSPYLRQSEGWPPRCVIIPVVKYEIQGHDKAPFAELTFKGSPKGDDCEAVKHGPLYERLRASIPVVDCQ
jgi:hypothetical protein